MKDELILAILLILWIGISLFQETCETYIKTHPEVIEQKAKNEQ